MKTPRHVDRCHHGQWHWLKRRRGCKGGEVGESCESGRTKLFSVFVKSTQDKQVYGFLRLDPFAHGVGHQQQKVRFIYIK